MKTLIFMTFLAVSTGAWSQFKIVTQESVDGTTTFAICESGSSVVAVNEIYSGNHQIRILINKGISLGNDDYGRFVGMPIEFVFFGSGSEHHYTTNTVTFIQNGYEKTVWVVFEDQKLIEYFKKYNSVKVIAGSTFLDVFSFSLKNFSNCLKQL